MRLPDQLPLKLDIPRALLGEPAVESLPLHPPSGAAAKRDLRATTEFVRTWQEWTPPEEVQWEERNWAAAGLGRQRVPVRVTVGSWDRVAALIGRTDKLEHARTRHTALKSLFPATDGFAEAAARCHPAWTLLTDADFNRLCLTLAWFAENPASGLRARAVPIEGLDTKWVERHRSLVRKLLAPVGVEDLGLATGDATVRLRYLDPSLAPGTEFLDVAVPYGADPTGGAAGLTVIVVENKETFLALPATPVGSRAIAVWGAGYSGTALAQLKWITNARVLYWGDADADGYAILHGLRAHMPPGSVTSVAMDSETIARFLHLAVPDPGDPGRALPHLTAAEERARRLLVTSGNLRLEQERVSLDWALTRPEFTLVWGPKGSSSTTNDLLSP